jgi:prepilin-type N-terminal cleavage/methylation domain-containing protein
MSWPKKTREEAGGARRSKAMAATGFSAVEMLMVLAILAILFTSMYRGFETLNRSYTTESVKATCQQNARIGMEFMVHDLRLAGLDPKKLVNPLAAAGAGFVTATGSDMRFTADVNYDGDLNDPFEDIRYRLNGDRIEQTNHLGTATLLQNVTNLTFIYLDELDAVTTTTGDIRSVVISLTVERPSGIDKPVARTYTTRVRCRNM